MTSRHRISAVFIMSLLIYVILFATVLGVPRPASATEKEAAIDEMSVRVLPEYDSPRVLAIFEAKLSKDTSLPRAVDFMIPKSAVNLEIGEAYVTKDAGDYTSLAYNVETKDIFFEYYWDPFKDQPDAKDGKKSFKYEFKAPASVKSLTIYVQEPLKATDFKLEPPPVEWIPSPEGTDYSVYTYSNVEKGRLIEINANYIKTSPALLKPPPNPNNPGVLNQATDTRDTSQMYLKVLFFAVLLIGGIGMLIRRSQSVPIVKAGPKPKKSVARKL
jgi:hypothetical protein